ncbi:exodeoxyribonuclease VII small subunit [Balneolales bacterium ANBcel1]|nr:exodeoxyribonuclease VII small subunit [Balneolales bacterium ANBcel1]
MDNSGDKERFDFEHALERLSTVLKELESDDVPLEKAIDLYEEGMKLSKMCSKKLEEAELRIEQVSSKDTE